MIAKKIFAEIAAVLYHHMMTKNIGIYIYANVEVLDFAGPFEVFNTANRLNARLNPNQPALWDVLLISELNAPVSARYGLVVQPQAQIADSHQLDVLIVPGGIHTDELQKLQVINWFTKINNSTEITASVCTGAFLLAQAGLLTGLSVTTHWEDIADLKQMFPELDVYENTAWVDNGKIVCSAGISAGIEMSLHLVARLASKELAIKTARQMEYDWRNSDLSIN